MTDNYAKKRASRRVSQRAVSQRAAAMAKAIEREELFAARDCTGCDGACQCEHLAHDACKAGARAAQRTQAQGEGWNG